MGKIGKNQIAHFWDWLIDSHFPKNFVGESQCQGEKNKWHGKMEVTVKLNRRVKKTVYCA